MRDDGSCEGACWVCGGMSTTARLDMVEWQHTDCDAWPTEHGEVIIERGVRTIRFRDSTPGWTDRLILGEPIERPLPFE